MIKKTFYWVGGFLLLGTSSWFLGPKPQFDSVDNQPITLSYPLEALDSLIAQKEIAIAHLKADNEARIVWADSIHQRTPYSVVYIHGYWASQGEGEPLHRMIAEKLQANLYLSRLHDHGISHHDAFKGITPKDLVEDAKEAIAIGKLLGEKVIVMSCSTGGTLSIYLAAADPQVQALLLLSPNIAIFDSKASLLTDHWGNWIAHSLIGEYREVPPEKEHPYWTGTYHVDGLIALQALLDQTMKDEIFEKINIPIFLGYYYKNEEEQDHVVSVEAMKSFFAKVSTPEDQKVAVAFDNAGDHVISSIHKNPHWQDVYEAIEKFVVQTLDISKESIEIN